MMTGLSASQPERAARFRQAGVAMRARHLVLAAISNTSAWARRRARRSG